MNKPKFQVNDIVEIKRATGFVGSSDGDKATVISVLSVGHGCFAKLHKNEEELHLCDCQAEVIGRINLNRNRLADFIHTNNIRPTLVSRYLGYSKGWLAQAMTRTDRGDLDDSELQAIMDKLHIDWTSSEYVHVKATKQHTAYKTKPCSHTTEQHKARLQQSFWNGEFVK